MSWRDEYTDQDVLKELSLIGLASWMSYRSEDEYEDGFTIWSDGSWRFIIDGEVTGYQIGNFLAHFGARAQLSVHAGVDSTGGPTYLMIDIHWRDDDDDAG